LGGVSGVAAAVVGGGVAAGAGVGIAAGVGAFGGGNNNEHKKHTPKF
jgi:hypothetical protein